MVRTRTASGSDRPRPAAIVSAACSAGLSPGESATAMPPCAQALALSDKAHLVRTTDPRPSTESRHAVHSPAIPAPTISGAAWDVMGEI